MTTDSGEDDRLTLEQQVCFTLAVASREVVSLYRPLLEPLGLTHPQYLVMVTLWETDQPISIKQLSKLLMLEAPTLSPLLKRLQSAGLVERQRDSADERSLQVSLTDRGRNLRGPSRRRSRSNHRTLGDDHQRARDPPRCAHSGHRTREAYDQHPPSG